MTEGHLGRVLGASLHQAIADELPQRLDFYEHWLHFDRAEGSIGRAPMAAVIGFLRTEGDAYDRVMRLAGRLSAQWSIDGMSAVELRAIQWLPRALRVKAALRVAAAIARAANPEGTLVAQVRGATARVRVTESIFCSARAGHAAPLCGFYGALIEEALGRCEVGAVATLESCRAMDGSPCVVSLAIDSATREVPPAVPA